MQSKVVSPAIGTPVEAAPRAYLRSHATWLSLILGFALVTRLIWIGFSDWQPLPDDDAFRYDFAARALADGEGYIHTNGAPTAFWPPGYPLLLAGGYAIFGQHVEVGQLLNVALGTATVGLVYLLGRRLLNPTAALVGAGVVAAFPSLIFFTAVTLSEVAFTFFALLGVYLLFAEAQSDRKRDLRLLLAAGLTLGLASLIRGQALLLPLVLIPVWWRMGFPWPRIGDKVVAVVLGIGLVVAPWSIRNAMELDAPVLIATNAGVDFWIGHHEQATGDFGAEGGDELVFSHPELTSVEREVRINREGFQKGLAFAVTHPVDEFVLPFKKLFWLYYNDEAGLKWNEGHGGQRFLSDRLRESLLGVSNVYYYSVMALLLLGAPLWFSIRDPGRLTLVLLLGYWTVVHMVFFGDTRFHAPIMPVVALLAALPIAALWGGRAPWSQPT